MQIMLDNQLEVVCGGAETIQKDLGQFVGGATGWTRANPALYLLLGPGIGGLVAGLVGFREATL